MKDSILLKQFLKSIPTHEIIIFAGLHHKLTSKWKGSAGSVLWSSSPKFLYLDCWSLDQGEVNILSYVLRILLMIINHVHLLLLCKPVSLILAPPLPINWWCQLVNCFRNFMKTCCIASIMRNRDQESQVTREWIKIGPVFLFLLHMQHSLGVVLPN